MAEDSAVYEVLNPNFGFFKVGGKFDLPVPYSFIFDESISLVFCNESSN